MKLGIKQIVIIFLVALLGGACGTYGIYELTYKNNTDEIQYQLYNLKGGEYYGI